MIIYAHNIDLNPVAEPVRIAFIVYMMRYETHLAVAREPAERSAIFRGQPITPV